MLHAVMLVLEALFVVYGACFFAYVFWFITRWCLVYWIDKREKREARANAIRNLLGYESLDEYSHEGHLDRSTIDHLIYGNQDPRQGFIRSVAVDMLNMYTRGRNGSRRISSTTDEISV